MSREYYYDHEPNKIFKDSKIQLMNNASTLAAVRDGTSPSRRNKYTLDDQVNFAGETATNRNVRQLLNTEVRAQCIGNNRKKNINLLNKDTKNIAMLIARILKEEQTLLSTRQQVTEFIPRFQNFMDSLNYVAPAYKNLSKLDCQGINLIYLKN